MTYRSIQDIEGIGPKFAEILNGIGIATTDELLTAGGTRLGRKDLIKKTKISETLILKWVNMCDLFRINGIAGQYAELLKATGVDTVKELRNRNPENLTIMLIETNAKKKLMRQTPSLRSVADWVEQAKKLPPAITY